MKIDEEELSIYTVEAFYKELLATYKKENQIIIDIQNVKKIDMSTIQLFVSLQKSCSQSGKTFQLKNINKEINTIFSQCACEFLIGAADG